MLGQIETDASGTTDTLLQWIEYAALAIELFAVAFIIVRLVNAGGRYVFRSLRQQDDERPYGEFKVSIGKTLLLGLEMLVAADIVRTVALEPTLENLQILGLLVVIRTFLSWSLVVEIEGRWPWRARSGERDEEHT